MIKSGYLSVVLEFLKPIPRISCAINDGPKVIIFWGQLKNKEQTKKKPSLCQHQEPTLIPKGVIYTLVVERMQALLPWQQQ